MTPSAEDEGQEENVGQDGLDGAASAAATTNTAAVGTVAADSPGVAVTTTTWRHHSQLSLRKGGTQRWSVTA